MDGQIWRGGRIKYWWRQGVRATLKVGWGGKIFYDIKIKEEDEYGLKYEEKTRQSAF